MVIHELKWIHTEPTSLNYGHHSWSNAVSSAVEHVKKNVANFSAAGSNLVHALPRYVPGIQTKTERLSLAENKCVDLSEKLSIAHIERAIAEEERDIAQEQSGRDALTGLPNRRRMFIDFARLMAERKRQWGEITIYFIDADDFKKINDWYDHATGDFCLKMLAETLNSQVREGDVIARYGWEEFLIAVRHESPNDYVIIGDRIVSSVRETTISLHNGKIKLTVSVGAYTLNAEDSIEGAIGMANKTQKIAKEKGKNRIEYCGGDTHKNNYFNALRTYSPQMSSDSAITQ